MSQEIKMAVDQAFHLAKQIRKEHRWYAPLVGSYWGFAFMLTRVLEKYIPQRLNDLQDKLVLNFGCGNKFYDGAVNSDLFSPHRYIKRKKRPDLYWSGVTELEYLNGRFKGVVCEHVIEHMLPDNALGLFRNFQILLEHGGVLVVSFPDIRRVLAGGICQGYRSPTVSMNSVVYRHGHRFMYDKEIVGELLSQAGFKNIKAITYNESPLQDFLDPTREIESSYVIAER